MTMENSKKWPHGGLVGIPEHAYIPTAAEILSAKTKQEIIALEATQTPRRIREAALGIDGGWLAALNAAIAAKRALL